MHYDIFISYKRKSLPTANNLYYRLTTRGYSTFFDLEEMRRDNFNLQLLSNIENAKDIFVILEEGSLDSCKKEDWEKDWFCHEIAFALEKKKNIIPILIGGFQMPSEDFFPDRLKELSLKNAPEFNFSFFEAYLDKLVEKNYLLSKPNIQEKVTSVFKFYSNENCQVYKEGKLVCSLEGLSDEPYYLPVPRKGDYRFKAVNIITADKQIIKEHIDADEEKDVDIEWNSRLPLKPDQEWPTHTVITGDNYLVDLGYAKFNMIRVEGGELLLGATQEQESDAEANEYPVHKVSLKTFYIGQFPITQNIWEIVMGYNKSHFRDKEKLLVNNMQTNMAKGDLLSSAVTAGAVMGSFLGPIGAAVGGVIAANGTEWLKNKVRKYIYPDSNEVGHYPAENVSHDEALEFVRRLSKMTNINFSLATEEEWEYAARGGQKSQSYKYTGGNVIDEVAWYRDNADGTTHPVGEMAPNELGLYDMSGNVWEWTETPAHSYESDVNTGGPIFIRRGGSWWHEAKNCRVSRRYASDHSKKTSGLGLRVVIRKSVE
jgi:formylglycine-generating enzyme required for sulfatase activity